VERATAPRRVRGQRCSEGDDSLVAAPERAAGSGARRQLTWGAGGPLRRSHNWRAGTHCRPPGVAWSCERVLSGPGEAVRASPS
jgi:hypothetical protein